MIKLYRSIPENFQCANRKTIPARLLLTHHWPGDFGAISVTDEAACATLISTLESRKSDRYINAMTTSFRLRLLSYLALFSKRFLGGLLLLLLLLFIIIIIIITPLERPLYFIPFIFITAPAAELSPNR